MDDAAPVRIRLDLSYDGTDFAGWASQPGLRTIQGTVEAALGTVLRCPPPRLTVAGRTDAGVHARGQVAHLDLPAETWTAVQGRMTGSGEAVVRRMAGVLPRDVVVRQAAPAPAGFDARFGALFRRYAYRLADEARHVDPLRRHEVVRHGLSLDVAAMERAATMMIGRHDFAAYCRPREGATTIRTLEDLRVLRPTVGPDAGLVVAVVQADAFCHSMVRSLVGALLAVGEGRKSEDWPVEQLAGSERRAVVAPAHGLTLEHVAYPADEELAERAARTRARRTAEQIRARRSADEARSAAADQAAGLTPPR